jgi:hypothetical protein
VGQPVEQDPAPGALWAVVLSAEVPGSGIRCGLGNLGPLGMKLK